MLVLCQRRRDRLSIANDRRRQDAAPNVTDECNSENPSYDGFAQRRLAGRERELERCRQAVGRLPAEPKSILDAVVVFDRVPRWMAPLPPRASDVREADLLVAALDALAQALGYERIRVA